MTIESAERSHEREEIEDYAGLLDREAELAAAEAAAWAQYIADAEAGLDDDWARRDIDSSSAALLAIAAALRQDASPIAHVSEIRAIVAALQRAAADAHVESLSNWN